MNFELSEDQRAIQEVALAFARDELAPIAAACDREHRLPVEVLKAAAAVGFAGLYTGEEHGGTGLGRLDSVIVFEALAQGDPAVTAFLSIHNMATWMIDRFGQPALRARLVPLATSMEVIASYCLTEPGAGSDAAALRTRAVRDGDHYVLSGSKAFISGGGVSDVYVVMARTGEEGPRGISAFVVEKGTEGLSFGAQEHKLGWNAQPTAAVNLDNCRIPAENRLGEEGEGFKIAMTGLDGGRLNIGACSIGGAAFALETTKAYLGTRRQFGRSLSEFDVIRFKLADMATNLEAARLMIRNAAAALDRKDRQATMLCAMAKRFATDACFDVANEALQLHGGYGYLMDYPLERVMRDLRAHQIIEGTNEIMRVVVARELLR